VHPDENSEFSHLISINMRIDFAIIPTQGTLFVSYAAFPKSKN